MKNAFERLVRDLFLNLPQMYILWPIFSVKELKTRLGSLFSTPTYISARVNHSLPSCALCTPFSFKVQSNLCVYLSPL